jgi:hypothetical protein
MARRPTFLVAVAAVACLFFCALGRTAQAADTTSNAGEELYWAFHSCDEGMQEATPATRRVQLLDDYRFRRARAVRADAGVLKADRTRDYVVREWIRRCDVTFPKLAAQGRKDAAREEAALALTQCRTATDRGTLEQAEADYRAFRENKENALRHDPKVRAKKELLACDKRVAEWIAKRRQVEDVAIKRIRQDAEKTLVDAARVQDDSLANVGKARSSASASLAVVIPSR